MCVQLEFSSFGVYVFSLITGCILENVIASKRGAVTLKGVWIACEVACSCSEEDVTAELGGAGVFLGISKSSLHFPFLPHPESWKSI